MILVKNDEKKILTSKLPDFRRNFSVLLSSLVKNDKKKSFTSKLPDFRRNLSVFLVDEGQKWMKNENLYQKWVKNVFFLFRNLKISRNRNILFLICLNFNFSKFVSQKSRTEGIFFIRNKLSET